MTGWRDRLAVIRAGYPGAVSVNSANRSASPRLPPAIGTIGTIGNRVKTHTTQSPLDMGVLPERACSDCGGGLWWRVSACEPGGPGQWACERCDPPPPDIWRDACAVPMAGEDGCRDDR